MDIEEYTIRNAEPSEFTTIGKLMSEVYSSLEGFPKENEQPDYYKMLTNVGKFVDAPETEIIIATDIQNKIVGAVIYFGDIQYYDTGVINISEKRTSGFRLLAVSNDVRSIGIGKLLINECIRKADDKKQYQMIIHTTLAMQTAWKMYENIGFKRSEELDFNLGKTKVYGFRLNLLEDKFMNKSLNYERGK